MSGQGRPSEPRRALLAAFALGACLLIVNRASAEPERVPPEWLADAELTDVCFLDPDRGWAVGDGGVIWRTDDGGRHWRLDESPVACRLESISASRGQAFAVGGFTHPYTFKSTGVVLRTREGTRRWESVKSAALPALKQVKFLDAHAGWAVGNGSALYPAGVFKSTDGGRSWASVPSAKSLGWQAADFRDSKIGALIGQDGSLALVVPAGLKPSRAPNVGLKKTHRVRLWGSLAGWLVGDGGLVLTTTDGGHTWQAPAAPLPEGVENEFDFRALAVYDKHVWIAGTPGTCVFHSGDGGKTWDQVRTEQPLPINSLQFLDEQRGWAVGALGTILATTDGGKTWRKQHGGASRVAILGVFGDAPAAPLELLARLSGDEGYLSALEILCRRPAVESAGQESPPPARLREAMSSLGVSSADTAWRFPIGMSGINFSNEAILKQFDDASDGHGLARLEAHLVRKIRQWRPEIIVTDSGNARNSTTLARLVYQNVVAATDKAADSSSYPEQIELTGLAPWRVKKVISSLPEGERGMLALNTAQLAPRLGRSLADQASTARGLLHPQYHSLPSMLAFQMPINRGAADLGERDFFAGVSLAPGGEARRLVGQPATGTLDSLQRMAQKQRNIRQLLARSTGGQGNNAGWLAQIEQLTGGLSPASAGEILFQLGLNYHESGQGDLAAESFEMLIERHGEHALAEAALIWLMQYHASSEATHRRRGPGFLPAEATHDAGPVERPIMAKVTALAPGQTGRAESKALALARRIEQSRPALFADPLVRFSLAAAQRTAGDRRAAESYFHSVNEIRAHDAWWACAGCEMWLAKPGVVCPKPVWRCVAASSMPRLNGVLDDEIWKAAKAVDLTSGTGGDERWPAQALLAYDGEFLYLAARCFKAPGVEYTGSTEARPRDADLSDQDRVELLLDLDRDYATFYRLAIDHRGWTSEACLGDKTWNPAWYVAAGGDAAEWIIEAAIPLAELAPRAPNKRDAWAVGVQRIVPTVGLQSFSRPAAVSPRGEGFGILMFE